MSLYHPSFERDNCGFGLIAQMDGDASHRIVRTAIHGLDRMKHRGGIAADGRTGDGCGLLMQMPTDFFEAIAAENDWHLSRKFAVGMLFLSQDEQRADEAKFILEKELQRETLSVAGWRKVPINPDVLGEIGRKSLPQIYQVLINAPVGWREKDLERRLYMARRRLEQQITDDKDFYVASLSGQVIVYKGLMMPADLPSFYTDLADIRLKSAICLFHQRFSTNTSPKWPLAQPFRYLAHNGEINTITGNRQWARARAYKFNSPLLPDLQQAAPFVNETGSDSSSLDNMLEMLLSGGMDLYRAMRLLIPPAWQSNPEMDDELKAFYDFNSMHMEPWDGPAGIVMTNGRHAACAVDRNGLRPSRYVITKDRILTLASEVGIWDYSADEVIEKGRVGPGELLVLDTLNGRLYHSFEIDNDLKRRHPYKEWMAKNSQTLIPAEQIAPTKQGSSGFDAKTLLQYQKQFGFTREELEQVIWVLASKGEEAIGSMGDDTPMAVLSKKSRSLYDYFRQKFAQVTNPPIDPLREKHVMSLATCVGREQNLFSETTGNAYRVMFNSPILLFSDFNQLLGLDSTNYRANTVDLNYDAQETLEQAIRRITDEAERLARSGTTLLVLSDRAVAKNAQVIPAAMAVGAVQRRLVDKSLRCDTNIIVETASARDPHHFAVLIGFGATAIYPYLAYESISAMAKLHQIDDVTPLMLNFRYGIEKGLRKIMSKMGISTVGSYRCSQQFEAVGLASDVIELCFKGVISRIEGVSFNHIADDQKILHTAAYRAHVPLPQGGLLKYVEGGEYHCFNPDVVNTLQASLKDKNYAEYKKFTRLVDDRPVATLRDLIGIKGQLDAVEQETVEGAETLYSRFDSAAMSIGALSPEAHEALAVAMNRLGGRSNSGEGGEDARRFNSERNSAIKQIASGRFGVTAHYLVNADVLQIKVAQGAKPGEGGQLPGHKVSVEIAGLRHARPGVTLISPPPHHDIYSIEDLAQLIFDLKQINPKALVSVKLVSEPGVGTIATGVAKAYADMITISGYDGGTGASPITSVKYAGSPWELGLAEVHQSLVENGLRHKIRLQVDGGLKTGTDVIKAALLGAESFGFGTVPMIALGCKYLRICHLNNCATGVATQDKNLRDNHYHGLPERVMTYFEFVAQEVREWMAALGVTKFEDLVGRSDWLYAIEGQTDKQRGLDLAPILYKPKVQPNTSLTWKEINPPSDVGQLNQTLLADCRTAVDLGEPFTYQYQINNTDRSVGATLSGYIATKVGVAGAKQPLTLGFSGSAGQSFGVWNSPGLELRLCGDANDYVGKGMSGGKIVIHPPIGSPFQSERSAIMGNTCLYGATGGKLFAAGQAGERFAVRNSGAIAVVEGSGDNCCEYMTSGIVVILGKTGVNFGAGMTGGFAYVFDQFGRFNRRVNTEMVDTHKVESKIHQQHLKGLIETHYEETGSEHAKMILSDFENWLDCFVLVKPTNIAVADLLKIEQKSPELVVKAG
ncbi:glutamate synthase large subunit [Shewanella sp. SR43-4]|uniref:glutamate synthase large subunit n=1 Tax=Shewanella TaxID=22 RepID=UPI000C6C1816|nr:MULTISPECIES: glutamate synthase large subunit [Shewanella]NCQ44661.1 glutamate synthase large subunit [Shewanella frigidimarina]MBB1318674.1 glutamate synthase large subunit [Shewanella sp. SR43-4]MBB1321296.1 glutamate synthase large subunit [Shewanella sp. SR43-8]MBB1388522.1 glutamate synthase large subunit [Shewanella sp. SG44-6]NCO72961.1 glutamate synthase large subunit [Shewanella vesiculosa]